MELTSCSVSGPALRTTAQGTRASSPSYAKARLYPWRSLLILASATHVFPRRACPAAAFSWAAALARMRGDFVTKGAVPPPSSTTTAKPRMALQAQSEHGSGRDENAAWDINNDLDDSLYMERFKRRREEVRVRTKRREWSRPPNPFLDPYELVSAILDGLRYPETHDPDSGARTLLRASTGTWGDTLRRSVGAPPGDSSSSVSDDNDDDDDAIVASALRQAMGRRNNQFGILVAAPDAEEYEVSFPTEALDYGDGTCWLECRLRGADDDALLVAMGWSLWKRRSDGAWLVDAIDWQDFRESFRPGIGREEWERICG